MALLSEGRLEVQGLEKGVLILPLYKIHRAKLTVSIFFPRGYRTLPCGALTALVPGCQVVFSAYSTCAVLDVPFPSVWAVLGLLFCADLSSRV